MPKTKTAQQYPQHERLAEVNEKGQAIGEFLDWLDSRGRFVAQYIGANPCPVRMQVSINQLLAEYFQIDRDALEAEKRAMLARMRELNGEGGDDGED